MDRYDFGVVGAGIVGLAVANQLSESFPRATVLVVDKEPEVAAHQSGHNSGVIHAGIYYEPGSLKARFCKEGSARTKAYCTAKAIPFAEIGKLLVATNDLELQRLRALERRAEINGLRHKWIDAARLRAEEPNVTGLAALLLPDTGVVDYREVCRSLHSDILRARGVVELDNAVVAISEGDHTVRLETVSGPRLCDRLVVCGGLQADRLAALAGLQPEVAIVPFRGEYFRLPEDKAGFVRRLIYPVPDQDLPFLGVHLSPTIGGEITVGPSAVLGLAREGYPKWSVDGRDVAELLTFPGLWGVARANIRNGIRELRNSLSAKSYLREARKYAPSLTVDDLLPAPAGIRAQAVRRDGTLVHDFSIVQTARMLHVLNAPSPAATAALPIADHIVSQLRLTS